MSGILTHVNTRVYFEDFDISSHLITRDDSETNNTGHLYAHGQRRPTATLEGSDVYRVELTVTESGWFQIRQNFGRDFGKSQLFTMTANFSDRDCGQLTTRTWYNCSLTSNSGSSAAAGAITDSPPTNVNTRQLIIMPEYAEDDFVPLPR